MSASRSLLLTSLTSFYNAHPDYCHIISTIISGNSGLSLRILDWFVTHYARMNNVVYYTDGKQYMSEYPKDGGGAHVKKFNLYLEYRKQLQSYTKMFFDPFRRHERITFVVEQDPPCFIETTVGQLNFFRWATENHVISYVMDNLNDIESHMASHQKTQKDTTKDVTPKRDIPNTLTHGPCHVLFN